MTSTHNRKRLTHILSTTVCMLVISGCANNQTAHNGAKPIEVRCQDIIKMGLECPVATVAQGVYDGKHTEFEQQVLPIHERKAIIDKELDELDND